LTLGRRLGAEALGTAFLLAAVVGSGIMGERLAGGSVGLALLANSAATGAALIALISALGPVSGAHFNPVVTLGSVLDGELSWREGASYALAQLGGAMLGVAAANAMFELPVFSLSQHARHGPGQLLGEFVATFGLLLLVRSAGRRREAGWIAYAVGGYIAAAYWFTSSTSFANPAVTIARSFTDTFAGIRPMDVGGFIGVQLVSALAATGFARWLLP
jgi:glycerol uptake facilitator-like aquaporin